MGWSTLPISQAVSTCLGYVGKGMEMRACKQKDRVLDTHISTPYRYGEKTSFLSISPRCHVARHVSLAGQEG